MKDAEKYFSQIKKRIAESQGCVLILDFDGTLSKIAITPKDAFLKKSTKNILLKCLAKYPVAIASGRTLKDVKQKVGIKKINYAGNHGLDWQIAGKKHRVKVPQKIKKAIDRAANELSKFLISYPGIIFENKKLTLALHYRLLEKIKTRKFEKDFEKFILQPTYENLDLIKNIKAFELRPKINWTKADFVKVLLKYVKKKQTKYPLAIYIGDDVTDEDVFLGVKNIVSIRVGKNKKSSAKYFIKSQKEVNKFLSRLCSIN
ncbi:MAG: trehalose-phosphatase [Candidatus Staskawiczbacteria bacterium RIFOXYD2_FULL_37_9]|uniref:Trehalose 6-phosphate phosphatase n=1 Tax=Candidatus Staskawiczbacteria bacterium RIFOXYB1_FULL_37_44 TaxID=1802223 RepID=A0A1G2IXQ5_9BACT|nr:MAG: trehalose-phosphatase [Candidatus Staskawiczbacteria bacterium RIFOXYB1_FULL_37_44]OGZ83677.1 MAG: trehalose-phosphatase [Candidatus Staskawiczbacteria bacterium RIFOXYC1_FULL_37_52]OGZ88489.1 MAG: trehalose-phosphatase [Candidatus Staskawiczbacteria bacterium RIFOXYC2_FULL_37_19]OGZ90201.1 MAG: trehalose-phosphatase [Candidatus Staskawiczbacteria bacterium RIFOXYD1_FULL_37_110]OGZ94854.1 MAG: trehalose-phosphatase [Candidatus Staskawiczbacteria bacterium RIFOXYD2_FULL_37_9]